MTKMMKFEILRVDEMPHLLIVCPECGVCTTPLVVTSDRDMMPDYLSHRVHTVCTLPHELRKDVPVHKDCRNGGGMTTCSMATEYLLRGGDGFCSARNAERGL